MNKPLSGLKVALLVANGFCQDDMIAAQKALLAAGANPRIVSSESGLVNGWDGQAWGHHFAVDAPLASALSADYAVLVIPGGQRSSDKLKLTAHSKRFISSFMNAGKPAIVMNDALGIMIATESLSGLTVSGSEALREAAERAGAHWAAQSPCFDGALMSGAVDKDSRPAFVEAMMGFLAAAGVPARAAA